MRCGGRSCRSTAVAAAASGGATMAPSAIAAGQGSSGMSHRATSATAVTVSATATSARPVTARQLRLRSRGEESKAASSSTGATSRVSASSGSSVMLGVPGSSASAAPASASSAGYGAWSRRATRGEHGADQQQRDDELENGHEASRQEVGQQCHVGDTRAHSRHEGSATRLAPLQTSCITLCNPSHPSRNPPPRSVTLRRRSIGQPAAPPKVTAAQFGLERPLADPLPTTHPVFRSSPRAFIPPLCVRQPYEAA